MNCTGCDKPTLNQSWLCPKCALNNTVVLPRLIIGICGRARHGKNTVADTIHEGFDRAGFKCGIVTVSDVVWDEAKKLRKVKSMYRGTAAKWELDELVKLGHAERAKDEDHWTSLVAKRIVSAGLTIAVMPGVRFHNEVTCVRKFPGGVIVKVQRYRKDGSLFISPDRDPDDLMETTVDDIVADFEFKHVTGQADWLLAQAKAFLHCTFSIQS